MNWRRLILETIMMILARYAATLPPPSGVAVAENSPSLTTSGDEDESLGAIQNLIQLYNELSEAESRSS